MDDGRIDRLAAAEREIERLRGILELWRNASWLALAGGLIYMLLCFGIPMVK